MAAESRSQGPSDGPSLSSGGKVAQISPSAGGELSPWRTDSPEV